MDVKPSIQAGPVLVLLAIVLITGLLFPGDATFMSDEALLLQHALSANHQPLHVFGLSLPFTPAAVGLPGTRGAYYGPLPIWIYQMLLATTHNPIDLVIMRALLFSASTALALTWLARSMRLNLWFAVLSMLSPWLFNSSRALWDNTFCIPLAAVAVAAYGDFLKTPRRWPLLLSAIALAAMTLVHLMSLALIAAVMIHFLLFGRRWLARFRWSLLLVGVIWACAFWPYFKVLSSLYRPPDATVGSPWNGWWSPLLGGQPLTAFDWLRQTRPYLPRIFVACQTITLLPHLAVWLGMALIAIRGCSRVRRRSFTLADKLALLSLGIAACQSLLDGAERVPFQPPYFNATWIAYAIFAWYGVDALCRWAWKPAITVLLPVAAYVAAITVVLSYSILLIHHNGGTRSIDYGTVLQDQMRAARRIQQFSPKSPIDITYSQWRTLTWAKDALIALLPPPPGPRPLRRLLIRYRNDYPQDARIAVDDFPIAVPPSP
jgi:hypothetical protein